MQRLQCFSFLSSSDPGTKGHWNGWEVGITGEKQSSRAIENWVIFPEWPSAYFILSCDVAVVEKQVVTWKSLKWKRKKRGDLMGTASSLEFWVKHLRSPSSFFMCSMFSPRPPKPLSLGERVLHFKVTPSFYCFISLFTHLANSCKVPTSGKALYSLGLLSEQGAAPDFQSLHVAGLW